VDEIRKITYELAKIDEGKVKAIAEGDRVYLMIQDAPAELRKLADALEKIDVREIKALIAYAKPGTAPLQKTSSRVPKQVGATAFPAASAGTEKRVEAVLARFKSPLKKLKAEVSLERLKNGVATLKFACDGDCPPDGAKVQAQIRDAITTEVPEVTQVDVV
jgi:hypothetical protein